MIPKAKVPDNLMLMVKMTGELANLMCEIDHDMKCNEQGVLYLRCVKALYGHIEAARLFYDDLDNTIQKKMNFIQNQYDLCVYNKWNGDDKVTIRVPVDNLKISSRSKDRIMEVIDELRNTYDEITVHFGNEHDYLGMTLIYQPQQKTITLTMKNYIKGVLEQFTQENDNEVIKNVKTPASDNLFRVRKRIEKIEITKYQSSQFHSTVAKLLFIAKRGRTNILLAVSFLTTRVKSPDLDVWKKLLRVLGCLKETLEYDLTISCKDLRTLTWYIDGSYATHEDMKGHNGAVTYDNQEQCCAF
jgi:hypothetical protein